MAADDRPRDHQVPGAGGGGSLALPLTEPVPARRPTPGEEARTLVSNAGPGTLATALPEPAGHPFASVTPFGLLPDGSPVLCISRLAEHTKNLESDARCSLLAQESAAGDAIALGRVTLVSVAHLLTDETEVSAAREAFVAANPNAAGYASYGDFGFWRLEVTSLRWIAGFGRMGWVEVGDYAGAAADPTSAIAAGAVVHLNEDHADALLASAQALAGQTDATAARCERLDRYGLDLQIDTPRGLALGRVAFAEPCATADDLRPACVELTRRSRQLLGA